MRDLLQTNTISEFCSLAFWCRWDKALINIFILFWVNFGFVKGGHSLGLLFTSSNLMDDIATAFLATTTLLVVGLINKSRAAPK